MNLAECYRLLELRPGASSEEIKASYRRLARQYHPDANSGSKQDQEKFIAITEAYKLLLSLAPPSIPRASGESVQRQSQASKSEFARSQPPPPRVRVSSPKAASARDAHRSEVDRQLKRQAYRQLQQLLREQRFPRAIALVEGLSQRFPDDLEVRQWQALTYQRWGRYLIGVRQFSKARTYLKKALRLDPHNKSLWSEVERDFRQLEQMLL